MKEDIDEETNNGHAELLFLLQQLPRCEGIERNDIADIAEWMAEDNEFKFSEEDIIHLMVRSKDNGEETELAADETAKISHDKAYNAFKTALALR